MTSPAPHGPLIAVADGWRVEIPMPTGRGGTPVGWLSLNDRGHWSRRHKVTKACRAAARDASCANRLPRGLDHVHVQVEFRFPDRRRRDPSNFEGTAKPVIDALQPPKTTIIRDKASGRPKVRNGKIQKQEEVGWGVVPGDDPRYITRGAEMPVGEPLGRTSPTTGMVIITITPFPRKDTLC